MSDTLLVYYIYNILHKIYIRCIQKYIDFAKYFKCRCSIARFYYRGDHNKIHGKLVLDHGIAPMLVEAKGHPGTA